MTGAAGSAVLAWAVEALAASALLIALVLVVRGPVRRIFGAQVAYALWALPLLRLALPPLPQTVRDSVAVPLAAPLTQVGQQVTILIAPAAADSAAAAPVLTAGLTLALLWGVGAAAFLGWHLASYARFRRRMLARATLVDRIGGVTVVESPAAAGPLAFGIARRYVAFPRDFAARYDAEERRLALAHELGHHDRGDLVANWAALGLLALHWFNPIAWYAFRAFRADQEMANDARVLARLGQDARHAYACAIVKAAHGGAIAAACHLHTVDDLKGRLKMLGLGRTSRRRALTGAAAVIAAGTSALALTASGTQAAERMRAGVETAAKAAMPQVARAAASATTAAAAADVKVVIERDGERTVYRGADAEAWIAANPAALPPVPPVPPAPPTAAVHDVPSAPPVPPMPPVPPTPSVPAVPMVAVAGPHVAVNVPQVRSATCSGYGEEPVVEHDGDGGHRRITICTDRIARAAARAQAATVYAASARRVAMVRARAALRDAQGRIESNRHLSEHDREQALADLDAEIDHLEDAQDDQ